MLIDHIHNLLALFQVELPTDIDKSVEVFAEVISTYPVGYSFDNRKIHKAMMRLLNYVIFPANLTPPDLTALVRVYFDRNYSDDPAADLELVSSFICSDFNRLNQKLYANTDELVELTEKAVERVDIIDMDAYCPDDKDSSSSSRSTL